MSARGMAAPPGAALLDVLVVGDLNPDLLVRGDAPRWGQAEQDASMRFVLGGSAAICAAGMARLGLRVALCAVVADDELGGVAVRMLADHGVDVGSVRMVAGGRSGLSVHLLSGAERAIYTERGAMVSLTADEAAAAIAARRPRHVHLASVFLLPGIVRDGGRVLEMARAAGATVSVDTNFDPSGDFARPPWLLAADVLMQNEVEALHLTGRPAGETGTVEADPARAGNTGATEAAAGAARAVDANAVEAAARELAANGALVAVKRGARGAFALRGEERAEVALGSASAETTDLSGTGQSGAGSNRRSPMADTGRVDEPAATDPADAVGAGDSFDAGLVSGLLDGLPLRQALALACAAGSLSTREAGGTAAQPTLAEARARAAELPG